MASATEKRSVENVRGYWNTHTLGKQFVTDSTLEVGSPAFFRHIRKWMTPFRFPEIMPRIDAAAQGLKGKHLLEVGCGMGFDSAEFLRRGVRVTATDLTPEAVRLTTRHFEVEGLQAEAVQTENVLDLSFDDGTFDAVWACGVLHHTGDTAKAIREIHRVLKPGGVAILSHFYRRPSWMYILSRVGRENIEFKDEDAPVTDFMTEREILSMFDGFRVDETAHDHYRLLPVARKGVKAWLYTWILKPVYNLLPAFLAKRLAYKFSVIATKT